MQLPSAPRRHIFFGGGGGGENGCTQTTSNHFEKRSTCNFSLQYQDTVNQDGDKNNKKDQLIISYIFLEVVSEN